MTIETPNYFVHDVSSGHAYRTDAALEITRWDAKAWYCDDTYRVTPRYSTGEYGSHLMIARVIRPSYSTIDETSYNAIVGAMLADPCYLYTIARIAWRTLYTGMVPVEYAAQIATIGDYLGSIGVSLPKDPDLLHLRHTLAGFLR